MRNTDDNLIQNDSPKGKESSIKTKRDDRNIRLLIVMRPRGHREEWPGHASMPLFVVVGSS